MEKTTVYTLRFLDGISLDKPMERAIQVGSVLLATNKELLRTFATQFGSEALGNAIRNRFEDTIKSSSNELFALQKIEIDEKELTQDAVNIANAKMIAVLVPYSTALWLQHDYSMEVQLSYSVYKKEGSTEKSSHIHPYPMLYYDAKGKMQGSSFTTDELNTAVSALEYADSSQTKDNKSSQPYLKCLVGFNRLNRAWLFIHAARIEHLLPYRLVNYVSCLECLLSRDTTELAHKLAERAGLLIGSNQASRFEWYKSIKEAYEHRSRFVHGGIKKCEDVTIEDLSAKCDMALRELMSFSNGSPKYPILFLEENSEDFNNYFLGLLFREAQ
ncbi:MAG: HEPN domain-containing protein [bacterium]|nr:HEPN domain-containing protein [bacterium]